MLILDGFSSDYVAMEVETSAFASSASVSAMLRQAEELFAAQFGAHLLPFDAGSIDSFLSIGGGDKKRALARLRPAFQRKSFHSSSLKSGIALGFALPVFVSGIYQSNYAALILYVLRSHPPFQPKVTNRNDEQKSQLGISCYSFTPSSWFQFYFPCSLV